MNIVIYKAASNYDSTASAVKLKNGNTLTPVLAIFGLIVTPTIQIDGYVDKSFLYSPEDTVVMPNDVEQHAMLMRSLATIAKLNTAVYASECNRMLSTESVTKF